MDWCLYHNSPRHERVNCLQQTKSEIYSGFLQTSGMELFTKIISNVNIMLFNYSRIKFNLWRLTGPECGSADAYNTVLKIQIAISPWQQVKVKSLHFKFVIYSSKHKRIIKATIKSYQAAFSGTFLRKIFLSYYQSIPGGVIF